MKIMFLVLPMVALAAFIDMTASTVVDANIAHQFPYPLNGMMPVIALFAVGLISSRYPGNWRWGLPAAFVLMFTVGLGTSMRDASPFSHAIDLGVLASLVTSVLLALSGRRPPLPIILALFAVMAWVLGFSHGAQIKSFDNAIRQSREIACAVLILLLAGLAAGVAFRFFVHRWTTPLSERIKIPPHETP
jgi:hydrogenase/urease accessory protein HupE